MISPAGMTWYMVWPGELWHGILYGLAGMAWYMIRPDEVWHSMCKCLCEFIALGYGPVHMWRSRCQLEVHVQDPFTSKVTITCMFRSHVQLQFTLGSDSTLRDCEYISLFWDRIFEKAYTCNIY